MECYTTEEPIYALATPFSPSALAVIRASGNDCLSLIGDCFTGRTDRIARTGAVHGYIHDGDRTIDEVVMVVYRKGHGYTSEEAFEIMCHGSLPVISSISALLERCGIRKALKGEFSYRAFMHGRIDLTEAEAVEEIVKARSERAGDEAVRRLGGILLDEARAIKDRILDILASVEVQLDYAEDEIPEDWIFPIEEVESIISRLRMISSTYRASRLYSQGASVVLAGRTNAGKSSLFNALLKENRAIVSSQEGTTRDYIEAECHIGGIPVRLFDTAGFRASDNEVEEEGIRRSRDLVDSADLVVYVLDADEDPSSIPERDNVIAVRSKRDLTGIADGLSFSSLTGEGLGDVIAAIEGCLKHDIETLGDVPTIDSERQKEKIDSAASALEDAIRNRDMSMDIIALYFQSALRCIGELTGEVTTEDVLERLFSSFCLGK